MGRILVPRKEIIPPENTFRMPTMRMGGYVRCQIHRGKSGTLKYDTGWFPNIITDKGLGYYGNAPQGFMFNQCAVGTGTGTPTVSDNGLFAYLAATATNPGGFPADSTGTGYVAAAGSVPAYYWNQNTFTFGTGVAAGNLTEVGIWPLAVTYGSGLFSHALILDSNGNPTTITVLSNEVLSVTYQVNYYIDPSDHSFSFPYNGSTTTGTYRTTMMGSTPTGDLSGGGWLTRSYQQPVINFYTGDIGAVTGAPSGSVAFFSNDNTYPGANLNFTNDMANTGTWYFDYQITIPTTGGSGTILAMQYRKSFINYQFGHLSQPIVKTSGQQLQASFRVSWGRYP